MIWLVSALAIAATFCAEYFRSRAVFWEEECRWWEQQAGMMEKELRALKPAEQDGEIVIFN